MKALLKVMETKTPAPEDVNTLLILTRDLLKKVPKGQAIPTLGFGSAFGQFGLEGVENMGLPETGDIIVNIGNEAHIKTIFGRYCTLFSAANLQSKYIKADFPPIYLFIKQSHSSGSKYF